MEKANQCENGFVAMASHFY